MPETITLYRVFISAPGDITEEHTIAEGVLDEWNIQHGQSAKTRLELVNWKTHTFPSAGKRPQALINEQAFDKSDVVVALFWTKFGTPTGKYDSGTEEEIVRAIKAKKPVLVYFSNIPSPDKKATKGQQSRIARFQKKYGQKAIYHTYSDQASFEKAFRNHLALAMTKLLQQTG